MTSYPGRFLYHHEEYKDWPPNSRLLRQSAAFGGGYKKECE